MVELPGDLYQVCYDTLLKCREFESHSALQTVFVTPELSSYRNHLPHASNTDERVRLTIDYLLQRQLRDGRSVFLIFLTRLQELQPVEDALRDELQYLSDILSSVIALLEVPISPINLQDVLPDKEINNIEQQMQDLFKKMRQVLSRFKKTLKISPGVADQLVNQVSKKLNLPLEEEVQDSEVPDQMSPTEYSEPEPPETKSSEKKLILCWDELVTSSVIDVGVFGHSTLLAFVIEGSGQISVFDKNKRLIYRDQVEGHPFQVISLEDRVLVGTWDGTLYCFGEQELLWQTELHSPVSVIAINRKEMQITVGTWDGQIVVFQSDGQIQWKERVDDGIASLSVSKEGGMVAVGTYAGHLAIFNSIGKMVWLKDMQSAIVRVTFANHTQDIIIATQNCRILQMHINNEMTVWEHIFETPLLDFSLSKDDRRIVVASKLGQIDVYSIDGDLNPRGRPNNIPELTRILIPTRFSDGRFILGLSDREGLIFLDKRRMVRTIEINERVICAAVSSDGIYTVVGDSKKASLYRLARPKLKVKLIPIGHFRRGYSARLQIILQNNGESTARDIKIDLVGPIDYSPLHLPDELKAGESFNSQDQLAQPQQDGPLQVKVNLNYADDLGISYGDDEVTHQILDTVSDV